MIMFLKHNGTIINFYDIASIFFDTERDIIDVTTRKEGIHEIPMKSDAGKSIRQTFLEMPDGVLRFEE